PARRRISTALTTGRRFGGHPQRPRSVVRPARSHATGGSQMSTAHTPAELAYALRVRGDSMHPAIRNGSFVVAEPGRACVPGEYVVLVLTTGQKMVKELVA